jgi:CheY-like chemotaxis protein
VGDNPAVQEHFEQVAAAVQQGSQLTSQMLAYAGHRMIEPGRVQLNDVLGELDRLLAATLRPNVRLDVNLPHDLPPVVADPAQLQQVCMNLINNAAEAMGDTAGTIEVRATVEVRDTESSGVGDARLEPGRYLRLTVRDTGPGMDPEAQARVFEPFYSTKGPGRGLGLAAVLGIVRAHGGAIEVQSAAGEGTRVAVLLPLGRQEQAEAARRQAGPRESRGAPPRGVLIVDGEPQLLRAAAELLRPHELAVQTAQDGKSALEAIEKDPAAVEVVVLDLTMPGMRSDEVYQEIRARWPRIRVVFSSGYDARDSSKRLGPDVGQRYLQKPYTEQALVEAVSGRKV